MILWNYIILIHIYLKLYIYIYLWLCVLQLLFYEFFFKWKFQSSKILIVKYENVHKFLKAMLEFVWIWKLCEGQVVVMFSTLLDVETWLDYPKNTIMFIKKTKEFVALTNY
jgi:hypothetical protein